MALLMIALLAACGTLARAAQTQPAETDKDVVAVKRGTLVVTVDADGYFEPVDAAEVRVRPESYQGDLEIQSIVPAGTIVKKGDLLLEIDGTQLQKQLAAAENDLATADANLTKAEADVQLGEAADALAMQIAQTELSNAEAGLRWWEQVDGQNMLKGADLSKAMAKAFADDQDDELDQLKKMYKSEELTSATADIVVKRAIRGLEQARIRQGMSEASSEKIKSFDYQTARQKLLFNIEQEKQQIAQLKATQEQQKALRQTSLASARQAADKAATKVADLRKDVSEFTVKAPEDGVVMYGQFQRGTWQHSDPRALRPSEKVTGSQVLMTIVAPEKLRFVAEIPEARIGMVKPGLKVRVVPTGYPDADIKGTCDVPGAVGVLKETGQVFPTFVELTKSDPRIHPGEKGVARFDAGTASDVLLLPLTSVSRGRVKVRDAGGVEQWKDVVVSRNDGEMVEIVSGLAEGDLVLTKPGK